jgi:hypothetical protein
MAVLDKDTQATEQPRFCQECGHALAGAHYCPECGRPVDSEPAATGATAELPAASLPSTNGGTQVHAAGGSRRPGSRVLLIAAAGALVLAGGAVLAIILINNSSGSSSPGQPAGYRAKLGDALAPVVSANQAVSTSLQALDGSKKTIGAAASATSQAQSAVAGARGAISVLTVPSSESTLSQQAQQAMTEENGYLQALSSTLSDPAGQSSSQLRPLITAAQSAMVPLAQVAPGATSSLSGIDNVVSWVAGATAVKQAAQHKAQQQPQQQQAPSTPPQSTPPSSSPSGLTACDQNISVNSNTSCPFADNVFNEYAIDTQSAGGPGSYTVFAYSPDNGQGFTDNCNYNPANQIVLCSHGSDLVQFPYWAAQVYQTH